MTLVCFEIFSFDPLFNLSLYTEFDPSAVSEGHVQPAPPLSVPNVGFGMPQEGTAAENSHMTLMTGTTSPPETGYANHAKVRFLCFHYLNMTYDP